MSISKEYDFIIIGGGTSGLVLAARLSEHPATHVLVLEAGENHLSDPRVNIPALWPSLLGSDCDWSFATTPQNGLNGRTINHPQGRALGGSSSLNSQAFIAPSDAGIDVWGRLGNPGWDWKIMAPYYRKCHTLSVPPADVCEHLGLEYLTEGKYKGDSGPIKASYTGTTSEPLARAWVDTFRTLNYSLTGDPFSGGHTGGFANSVTISPDTKERSYSASAYFAPVQSRSNLRLLIGSQVEKITFDDQAGPTIASGVTFTHDGIQQTIKARKEVILAAGVFNSPKILELSGVGGADLLQSHGIEVIIDNPNVGENLQDHLMTGISFEVKEGVETLDDLNRQNPEAAQAAMTAYQTSKTGPLGGGAVNSFAFLPVVDFQASNGKETLQHILDNCTPDTTKYDQSTEYDFVRTVLSSEEKSSAGYFMYAAQGNFDADGSNAKDITITSETGNFITIAVSYSYPLSRGTVHIRSASVAEPPTIDPHYLSHPLDQEIHARHLRFIETIVATDPLASLLKPDGKRSPKYGRLGTDLDAAKDYLRRTAISGWHPVGTCAMRPREKGGVLNERLMVHGSKNLRVVDASMMPLISRGNPQTTVYAVAERAADIIKEDHNLV